MDGRLPVLRGERVLLRPVCDDDAAPLLAMLVEPEVARWFGSWDEARVRRDLIAPQDDEVVLAIEVDGAVGGVLLVGEEVEPDYRCVGLDVGLDGAHQGRGLGPEALRLVIAHMIEARGHHRFTIDPAAANERAIRALSRPAASPPLRSAAVGFRPVGVMRRYERAPDGSWHDALLMDLLAEEFDAL